MSEFTDALDAYEHWTEKLFTTKESSFVGLLELSRARGDARAKLEKLFDAEGVMEMTHEESGKVLPVRTRTVVDMLVTQSIELRKEWWLSHGCLITNLYGDDGEMSCGSCLIDFKRYTPQQIAARLTKIRQG